MGSILIPPEPKCAKIDKLSYKKTSRQPMGVNKVASFEKLTKFVKKFYTFEKF
jgi:hypothetical protein